MPATPAALGSEVRTQARGAATELEHFFSVFFELLVPILAAVLGLVLGPYIFTGQSVADALWTTAFQKGQSEGAGNLGGLSFALGGLAGVTVTGLTGWALWTWQEGKSGLGMWLARAGAGFMAGWAFGIGFRVIIGEFTGNTTGAGNMGWLDAGLEQAWTRLSSSLAQATARMGGSHPSGPSSGLPGG